MGAVPSTLTLTGNLETAAGGLLTYAPPVIANPQAVGQAFELPLGPSPVLVTLPAGSLFFGVQPPPGNVVPITHQWTQTDTGGRIHPQIGIPALAVDPSYGSFYLSASAAVTVTIWSA